VSTEYRLRGCCHLLTHYPLLSVQLAAASGVPVPRLLCDWVVEQAEVRQARQSPERVKILQFKVSPDVRWQEATGSHQPAFGSMESHKASLHTCSFVSLLFVSTRLSRLGMCSAASINKVITQQCCAFPTFCPYPHRSSLLLFLHQQCSTSSRTLQVWRDPHNPIVA
jgi:hypothetical protein